ncbi:GNAT family N-acetyltransferase [Ruegeria sp.]|uniref:GNAT family N-acetyltransferase n=1 Tax=Ruegeria sp. TaxID=1879320 RepID=UPI0023166A85|nr:GNAT family N-acetyltransferase [Ruegeria sp.]MDA7963563.1 GNAT family N-acetyltransferase [Ruegeria sp.]
MKDCADLTSTDLAEIARLQVTLEQAEFGGSFADSLSQFHAGIGRNARCFAFFCDSDPIGIVILKVPPAAPDWVGLNAISLHGFKIAKPWQGKGLGKRCFGLCVDRIRSEWPDVERLQLAVDAENVTALSVYRSYGMTDSGPVFDGRLGKEHRLELPLYRGTLRRPP